MVHQHREDILGVSAPSAALGDLVEIATEAQRTKQLISKQVLNGAFVVSFGTEDPQTCWELHMAQCSAQADVPALHSQHLFNLCVQASLVHQGFITLAHGR